MTSLFSKKLGGGDTPFFSIILPTYNRKYCIKRMIDSVLRQNFQNFELIIVDDGSTDGTFEMLEESYQDKRIKLVRKENGGVSSARNLGISLARGEYITFVDSDDYLLDGFFEDAYHTIQQSQLQKSDLLAYPNIVSVSGLEKINTDFFMTNFSPQYRFTSFYKQKEFLIKFCLMFGNPQACSKFFRRKIIDHFDEYISFGEDLAFVIKFLLKSSYIQIKQKGYYIYNIQNRGLSRGELTLNKKIDGLILGFLSLKSNSLKQKSFIAYNYVKHLRFYIPEMDHESFKKYASTIKIICKLARDVAPSKTDWLEIFLIEKSLQYTIVKHLLIYIYKKYPETSKFQSYLRRIRKFL